MLLTDEQISVIVGHRSIHFDEDMRFFTFLIFDVYISNVLPLLLLSGAVFTKLEVSTAFLFREYRRQRTDGRTDRRTRCNF